MKKEVNFRIEDARAVALAAATVNSTRPAPLQAGTMISYEWFPGKKNTPFKGTPALSIYLDTGYIITASGEILEHMMNKIIGDEVLERLKEGTISYEKEE